MLLHTTGVAVPRVARVALQPNSTSGASIGASPSDLCPEPRFREMLTRVGSFLPGALAQAGGAERIVSHFLALPKDDDCPTGPRPPRWRTSERTVGPIMNVGQGTTGTRFLDCVFSRLGTPTPTNAPPSQQPKYTAWPWPPRRRTLLGCRSLHGREPRPGLCALQASAQRTTRCMPLRIAPPSSTSSTICRTIRHVALSEGGHAATHATHTPSRARLV